MHISSIRRGIFNHQADRIEEAFSCLDIHTRVQGGEVGTNRVRYHLAPLPDVPAYQVGQVALKLAEAIGVYQVRVDEEEGGWVVELPQEEGFSLRLLPLLEGIPHLLPLTAVIGIAASGKPVLLNLRRGESWHVFAYAPEGAGKSELLRTVVLSLALKNRPSQVQFMGIDLSGKELVVMEALPHTLSEVAIHPSYAEVLMDWLVDEVERRKEARLTSPDVILIIDELESVMHHSETLLKRLPMILKEGLETGVHLVATSKEIRPGSFIPHWRKSGIVIASARRGVNRSRTEEADRGQFEILLCGESMMAQVAWLPVHDLQQAVKLAGMGYRFGRNVDDFAP